MVDKEIIKTFKKPLIWVGVISILVIVTMGSIISSMSDDLNNYRQENLQKQLNPEQKCPYGTSMKCVDNGKNFIQCDSWEVPVCGTKDKWGTFNGKWMNPCRDGYESTCLDKETQYVCNQ